MIKRFISFAVITILFGCTTAPQEKLNEASKNQKTIQSSSFSPRHQIHYLYAHKVLPGLFLLKPQQTIALLEQEGIQFLRFILDDLQRELKNDDKLDISELKYSVIREANHKLFIIKLPQPIDSPEAYYVAMVEKKTGSSREYRYFTLEKTAAYGNQDQRLDTFFCEWTPRLHKNYGIGSINPPTKEDFLSLIRQVMEKTPAASLPGGLHL